MAVRVAPSLLAADFAYLAEEIRRVEEGGADMLHLDVMDGHFVPNLTIGPPLVRSIRKVTDLHFDAHLMLDNPEAFLEDFVDAGVNSLTIHLEVHPEPEAILERIGALGVERGLTINPDMPVERLAGHLDLVDRLLLMTVFPGFGGQSFLPESIDRIRQARALIGNRPIDLQVDGGIHPGNVRAVIDAGATNIVAGTSTFRAPDVAKAIRELRGA